MAGCKMDFLCTLGWFSVELFKFAAAQHKWPIDRIYSAIVVGKKKSFSDLCYMTDYMTKIVFLLSQFVCHLLFFLIFLVPVIFRIDYPFIVMRPSWIKFTGLHPGVRGGGGYLCRERKFQNPFFIECSWLVIWYNGSFEGGDLCDTKSPCWEQGCH